MGNNSHEKAEKARRGGRASDYSRDFSKKSGSGYENMTYKMITEFYQEFTHKERTIQIVGTTVCLCLSFIEIIIFILIQRILQRDFPLNLLLRHVSIFLIMIIITALTIYQFIIINHWNSKAKQRPKSLSKLNYEFIGRIQPIINVITSILIFNLIFLIVFEWQNSNLTFYFNNISQSSIWRNNIRITNIYLTLRILSRIIIVIYSIFEITQLIKWHQRKNNILKLEQIILTELPDLEKINQDLEDDDFSSF